MVRTKRRGPVAHRTGGARTDQQKSASLDRRSHRHHSCMNIRIPAKLMLKRMATELAPVNSKRASGIRRRRQASNQSWTERAMIFRPESCCVRRVRRIWPDATNDGVSTPVSRWSTTAAGSAWRSGPPRPQLAPKCCPTTWRLAKTDPPMLRRPPQFIRRPWHYRVTSSERLPPGLMRKTVPSIGERSGPCLRSTPFPGARKGHGVVPGLEQFVRSPQQHHAHGRLAQRRTFDAASRWNDRGC